MLSMTFITLWKKLSKKKTWFRDKSGIVTRVGSPWWDPQRCKVVGVKVKEAYKVTAGAGRENITMLAVVNAAGRVLDSLIIFSGKNLQSTWRVKTAFPGTFYAVSDNGRMMTP